LRLVLYADLRTTRLRVELADSFPCDKLRASAGDVRPRLTACGRSGRLLEACGAAEPALVRVVAALLA